MKIKDSEERDVTHLSIYRLFSNFIFSITYKRNCLTMNIIVISSKIVTITKFTHLSNIWCHCQAVQSIICIINILTVSVAIIKLFQYMPANLEPRSNESDDTRIKGINGASI